MILSIYYIIKYNIILLQTLQAMATSSEEHHNEGGKLQFPNTLFKNNTFINMSSNFILN